MYIMKPAALSCGRGIKVIGQKTEIKKKPGYVVCQYISNPHLINGFKYDLRIYCLVTCYDPLKVYIFKEGLVRFATQKYTNSQKSVDQQYIHLTNYSVNKHNEDYVKNNAGSEDAENSSKWNLAQLKKYYQEHQLDYDLTMHRIRDVLIKTLISQEPHVINSMSRFTKHKNVCFELYGFDILVDNKLKPWLLEVNISPSLSSSSPLDKKIKTVLIADTLNLVGIFPYDRKQYDKDIEAQLKKRLLGMGPKSEKEETQLELVQKDPNSYLSKLIKIMDKDVNNFDKLTDEDLTIILDFEEEQFRLGNFEKIFPCINNVDYYN
jgi:tubulin polyglutamylase TTLL4